MPAQDLIDAFLIDIRERTCSDETVNTYRWQLTTADRCLPYGLDCATEEELRGWIWRDDYALSSRKLCYSALAQFFAYCARRGYLDFNPALEIPAPRVPKGIPRVATDEDARFVLTQSPDPYRLWAHLAAYGGLRCIEIYRLRREHITVDNITVYGKGNKYRTVPTHPVVWDAVEALPPGPLVDLPNQQRLSGNFARWCKRRGIPLTMHRLRGWFATTTYDDSHDVRAVQELLGHSSLATTATYIAVRDSKKRAIVSALPVFPAAVGVSR